MDYHRKKLSLTFNSQKKLSAFFPFDSQGSHKPPCPKSILENIYWWCSWITSDCYLEDKIYKGILTPFHLNLLVCFKAYFFVLVLYKLIKKYWGRRIKRFCQENSLSKSTWKRVKFMRYEIRRCRPP